MSEENNRIAKIVIHRGAAGSTPLVLVDFSCCPSLSVTLIAPHSHTHSHSHSHTPERQSEREREHGLVDRYSV